MVAQRQMEGAMRQAVCGVVTGLLIGVTGCGWQDAVGDDIHQQKLRDVSGLEAAADLLVLNAQVVSSRRSLRDEMIAIEAWVPGFAGFYVDSLDRVVIQLTAESASRAGDARIRVQTLLAGNPEPKVAALARQVSQAAVRIVQNRLSLLVAIERSIMVHADPSLSGVGVSIVGNKVEVGLVDDASRQSAPEWLQNLGVDTATVVLATWGRVRVSGSWTDRYRPTRGGIRIVSAGAGNPWFVGLGSHGYNVRTSTGVTYMLLTSHQANGVTATNGAVGDTISQSQPSEGVIAQVSANPPWQSGGACGVIQDFCTSADVAAAIFVPGVVGDRRIGTSMYEGLAGSPGSSSINNWYPVEGVLDPEVIQQGRNVVHKSGFKTGTTTGSIDLPVVHFASQVPWPLGSSTMRTIWFMNATRVAQGGWGEGDSGAPVFAREVAGGPYWALGIEFAGSGSMNGSGQCNAGPACKFFFSPWREIEARLGLGPLNPRTVQ